MPESEQSAVQAARAASKAQRLTAIYRYWSSAYRDWADDSRCTDGTSILRRKFPDLSDETYKKITLYLTESAMRVQDNAWSTAEEFGVYKDDDRYEEAAANWERLLTGTLEKVKSSTNSLFSTDADRALITEISTFVAERVGDSLAGKPSKAENRCREHDAELQNLISSGVESAHAIARLQGYQRQMFLRDEGQQS